MSDTIPLLIGGLVLFLYAITQLSEVMASIFSDKAKDGIKKYTSHLLSAIIIGTLMTIILDSSSAVIILVIVFINARILTFRQAIGLIMGANIGTTVSSQIIALDVGKYAVIPLAIGLGFELFAKSRRMKDIGHTLLYFGMLFFGLYIMETSVLPLRDSPVFLSWMERIDQSPIQGALIGGVVTLIIQSSSGTVGMAIVLGKQGILSLAGGVAVMLGAELGTCSDTLIATVGGRREALKAGLFHLLFNFTTILIGLALFDHLVSITAQLSGGASIGRSIANAHMLFNILGVVLCIPFVGLIERGLNRLLPTRPTTVSS